MSFILIPAGGISPDPLIAYRGSTGALASGALGNLSGYLMNRTSAGWTQAGGTFTCAVSAVYQVFIQVTFVLPAATTGIVQLNVAPAGGLGFLAGFNSTQVWSVNGASAFTQTNNVQYMLQTLPANCPVGGNFIVQFGYDGGNNAVATFGQVIINRVA